MSYIRPMSTDRDGVSALNKAIGGRVAWYMKYAGDTRHTQADLAALLGIEQSAVSKKLTGRRPFFPHELYAIAEWLDRPMSDFLPVSSDLGRVPDIREEAVRDTHRESPLLAA
jgi:transcriptional regulator with XRE-family HTH domain